MEAPTRSIAASVAFRTVSLALAAVLCAPLTETAARGPEVLLAHFRGDDHPELVDIFVAPGEARRPPSASPGQTLEAELLAADGSVVEALTFPDPREILPASEVAQSVPRGRTEGFSVRLPWNEGCRRLRLTGSGGALVGEYGLPESAVQNARQRYRALRSRLAAEAPLFRPVVPRRPSGPAPADSVADGGWQRRAETARELAEARMTASRIAAQSDSRRGAVQLSFRVRDSSGQPVVKAGVVAVDVASGRSLGGAETGSTGQAVLSVSSARVRAYLFPPYTSSGSSPYARRIVDLDLSTQSPVPMELVLDGGVLVTGKVTLAGRGAAAGYSVTAVEASGNASIEYARTDASGSFSMRVPAGSYRFCVGGAPGWGSLVSEPREIAPPAVNEELQLTDAPLLKYSGVVVNEAGEPLGGVRVSVYDAASNFVANMTTGNDGTFAGSIPSDGFLFVLPNSATRYQALTLPIDATGNGTIVLPQVAEIVTPDERRPQLGLVYGDPNDRARINLVFVGDGYTDIEEPFTDVNGNGTWDGDIYLDENRNGRYDAGEYYYNRNGVAGYQEPEPFEDLNRDGYRNSHEQALFDRNVIDYVRVLMGTSPWPDLLDRINIWRIRTISAQTAGDFPEFGIIRDTVLNTIYGVKATGFIVSVSSQAATELVQVLVPDVDHIVTISNSPLAVGRANANFGGNLRLRGGDFDNLSTVATHELGHAVGLLSDEYSDQTIVDSRWVYTGTEPAGPNVTTAPSAAAAKWAAECEGDVPSPTPAGFPGVGLFEGGSTYFRGIYRPEFNCMMRSNTPKFCAVCIREMRGQIISRSSTGKAVFPILIHDSNSSDIDRLQTSFSVTIQEGGKDSFLAWMAHNEWGRLLTGKGVENPALRLLGALRQDASTDREIFGELKPTTAWVGLSTNVPVKGFYLVSDPEFALKADGGVADPPFGTDLALALVDSQDGSRFRFSALNPSSRGTTLTTSYIDPAGKVAAEESRTLPALGHAAGVAPSGFKGWVRLRSSGGTQLQAVGVQYDDRSLSVQSAAPLMSSTAPPSTLVFPHWAIGGGYETRLALVSSAGASLRIAAFRADGTEAASPVVRTLAPSGQLNVSVRELFGLSPGDRIEVGYLLVTNAASQGGTVAGVSGLTSYSFNRESSAISPAESIPKETLLFSHIANEVPAGGGKEFLTGVTLLNPGSGTATFTMNAYGEDGLLLRERTMTLQAGQKVSRLLSGDPASSSFFTRPFRASSGYIVVTSDKPLYGFELFFTGDLALMASVPAQ